MVTTLAAALLFSCKPAYFPQPIAIRPPVTMACEAGDKVYRNHDRLEVSREINGCTIARCEGADRVRRTSSGEQVSRSTNACIPLEVYTPVVVAPPQSDVLRYGLSYR